MTTQIVSEPFNTGYRAANMDDTLSWNWPHHTRRGVALDRGNYQIPALYCITDRICTGGRPFRASRHFVIARFLSFA